MEEFGDECPFTSNPVRMEKLGVRPTIKPVFKATMTLGLIKGDGKGNKGGGKENKCPDKTVPSFSATLNQSYQAMRSLSDLKLIPDGGKSAESDAEIVCPTVEV